MHVLKHAAIVALGALASIPVMAQTPPDSALNNPPLYKTQTTFPTDTRTGMTAGLLLQRMPNAGSVSSSTGQITLTSPDGTAYTLTGNVLGSSSVLNSPAFTGTPTAPTPAAGNNSTQLATTAFVAGAAGASLPSATTSQVYGGSGAAGTAIPLSLSNLLAVTSGVLGAAPQSTSTVIANISGTTAAPVATTVQNLLNATLSNVDGRIACHAATIWQGGTPATCGVAALANPGAFSGTMTVPQPGQNDESQAPATTSFVQVTKPCVGEAVGVGYTTAMASFASSGSPIAGTSTNQPVSALPIALCNPPGPIKSMAVDVQTATATAFNIRMAIYADNGGAPGGPPLADSGTVSVSANATGFQIVNLASPVTLPGPGVYWLTFEASYVASPASLRAVSTGGQGQLFSYLGYNLAAGAAATASENTGFYLNQSFGAPPSSFTATGRYVNANVPLVWVGF